MKTILSLALLCLTLNAHGATYMLLSQTNAFKAGITNQAQANADLRAANWQASGTTNSTLAGQGQVHSLQVTNDLTFTGTNSAGLIPRSLTTAEKTQLGSPPNGAIVYDSTLGRNQMWDGAAWHSRVRLDGDTMTGNLVGPNFESTKATIVQANTNAVVSVTGAAWQFLSATNDLYFTCSNFDVGNTKVTTITVEVSAGTTNRNLAFDTNFVAIGSPLPTQMPSNHVAWFTFVSTTTTNTGVRVLYSPQLP